jgi:hypothetical protein
VDGRTLTLKYKDGEKKIAVPANAPIVTYAPGDKSDIKPGAKVHRCCQASRRHPAGPAWRIGRDGVTPPMWLGRTCSNEKPGGNAGLLTSMPG